MYIAIMIAKDTPTEAERSCVCVRVSEDGNAGLLH